MPTQEERIAALEQRVTDIELERLYERRKAEESSSSEQAYDAKQVNYRLTMLLGIASGQEHDIKTLKTDVSVIKTDVNTLKADVNTLKTDVNALKVDVNTLKTDVAILKECFSSLEAKVDEHTVRFDRLETMLTQVLTRLPEKP